MVAIAKAIRSDLVSVMPMEQVFQKHVVDGSSYLFREMLKQFDWEYELRYELAIALEISINDIVIVGSSKLGFSLKTSEFSEIDHRFTKTGNPRDKSDVDVAVVNRRFFDRTVEEVYHLSRHFDDIWIRDNWRINAFHKDADLCGKYARYLAKGWLRPDYLPGAYYDIARWRPVCDGWYKKLKRRVSVGFYSDWLYLKHYHMDNLERLRAQLGILEMQNG